MKNVSRTLIVLFVTGVALLAGAPTAHAGAVGSIPPVSPVFTPAAFIVTTCCTP
jgi:hypothetical protein